MHIMHVHNYNIGSDLQDDVPEENLGRPGRFTLAYMHTWAM